jgi:hypothetical protein
MDAESKPRGDGTWAPAQTADGSWTLQHPEHGEGCHSRAGAWLEAVERYAKPCRLRERALSGELKRFRLLDVGSGMGTNLAAALAALEGTGVGLEAVGLESEVGVLRATLELFRDTDPGPGRGFQRLVHCAFDGLLQEFEAQGPISTGLGFHVLGPVDLPDGGGLRLLLGDGRGSLPTWNPDWRCDGVFLDPFSRSSDETLWEPAFLALVGGRMAPGSWLSTYSAAYRVREGLALAGLRVGQGDRLGAKAEGTLATPDGSPPALPERVHKRLRAAGIEADWLA